jgi:hypothetical protein
MTSSNNPFDITLIIGLPGSGKSYLGRDLCDTTNRPFFDDADTVPLLQSTGFIITHPMMCLITVRTAVVNSLKTHYPDAQHTFLYFENDPHKARENAKRRADKPVFGLISYLTRIYTPEGTPLPIWSPS